MADAVADDAVVSTLQGGARIEEPYVGTLHSAGAAAADIPGDQPSAQKRNLPLVDGRFPALNSGKKEKKIRGESKKGIKTADGMCCVRFSPPASTSRVQKKGGGGGERFETKAAVVPDCGRGMYVEVGLFFFCYDHLRLNTCGGAQA